MFIVLNVSSKTWENGHFLYLPLCVICWDCLQILPISSILQCCLKLHLWFSSDDYNVVIYHIYIIYMPTAMIDVLWIITKLCEPVRWSLIWHWQQKFAEEGGRKIELSVNPQNFVPSLTKSPDFKFSLSSSHPFWKLDKANQLEEERIVN